MEEQELPAGWAQVPLAELIGRIEAGKNFRCIERPPLNGETGVVKVSAVSWGRFREEESKTVPPGIELDPETRIREGDLLFSRANTIELVGACVLVESLAKDLRLSDKILRLVTSDESIKPWIHRYLSSPEARKYLSETSSGNQLSMRNISQKVLLETLVPVAPLNEQRRIAAKLATTLAAVDACRQRLDGVAELLKRFRQAVLAAATSGELTREWREEGGATQDSWSTIKTKEAGKIQLGRQRSPKYHHGPTMRPYLRVQNVFEDRIDLDDVMEMDFSGADLEKYTLHPGDILLNEGQSPQYLGRPAMYRGELPGACFTNSLIRFQAGDSVLAEFALLVFRNSMHSGRYVEKGTITTNIAHLSAGRFGEVEFPLPPLPEQQEIVRRAQDLFTLADQLEARLNAARKVVDRLTPALLAKAFRGELVPQDPSDEPASVLLERIRAARQAEAAAGKPSRRGRKQAAAHPAPATRDAAPVPPDLLAGLLRECGALSERALLAASELDPERFQRQLAMEMDAGGIREDLEDGERVLVVAG